MILQPGPQAGSSDELLFSSRNRKSTAIQVQNRMQIECFPSTLSFFSEKYPVCLPVASRRDEER